MKGLSIFIMYQTLHDYDYYLPRVKALAWFWLIDATLVLTSMLSV
jgi:hypothetical protein